MKILKVLLIGILFLGISTSVSAQEKLKKTPQERATAHTDHMTKSLVLSNEQRAKVAELNLGIAQKNEAVRSNTVMTKEQKQEALKGNLEGRKQQLQLILTPEQMKKFEEHQATKITEKETLKKENSKQNSLVAPVELEEL